MNGLPTETVRVAYHNLDLVRDGEMKYGCKMAIRAQTFTKVYRTLRGLEQAPQRRERVQTTVRVKAHDCYPGDIFEKLERATPCCSRRFRSSAG